MTKLERITQQEQKTREKIAAMQMLLKQIDGQRTEQENLQIIQQVRALKLSREDLYLFLNGGELPPILAGALGEKPTEAEKIYSRRNNKKKNKGAESSDETPENEPDHENNQNSNFESEEFNHEHQ